MRIRDLQARISSSKLLLKVRTKCCKFCKRTQVTLPVGASIHITINCQIRLRITELRTLNHMLSKMFQIQTSFFEKVFEISTVVRNIDQKS